MSMPNKKLTWEQRGSSGRGPADTPGAEQSCRHGWEQRCTLAAEHWCTPPSAPSPSQFQARPCTAAWKPGQKPLALDLKIFTSIANLAETNLVPYRYLLLLLFYHKIVKQ